MHTSLEPLKGLLDQSASSLTAPYVLHDVSQAWIGGCWMCLELMFEQRRAGLPSFQELTLLLHACSNSTVHKLQLTSIVAVSAAGKWQQDAGAQAGKAGS